MSSGDSLVSFGSIRQWQAATRLIADGLRQRWTRIALVTLVFSVTGVVATTVLPRSYSTESRLLVRKNYVMAALASPRRAVPLNSEAPTQSAAAIILSRPALESIVRERRLVERWDRERPALLRLKDDATAWFKGPITDQDKTDALIDLLATRVRVSVDDEVLKISARWSDRDTVVEIVGGAIEAFLRARRRLDVQAVADTNAILAEFTEQARRQVDADLAAVSRHGAPRSTRIRVNKTPAVPAAALVAANDAGAQRAAAQAKVDALERRYLDGRTAIETRIAERRGALTERHPEMQALRRSLALLDEEPSELVDAREDLARLVASFAPRATPVDVAVAPSAPSADRVQTTAGRRADDRWRDEAYARLAAGATDPVTERLAVDELMAPAAGSEDVVATGREILKSSIDSYQDLRARLANVQIELQTAEAAFNYRYTIAVPALRPKHADSPKVPLVVGGAVIAGLLAGVCLALAAELKSRTLWSLPALRHHLLAVEAGR